MVYERGDSVALAVLSSNVRFPEDSPFGQVKLYILFPICAYFVYFLLQEIHDLVTFMLKVNPNDRPFIGNVIEKVKHVTNTIDNVV